MTTPFQRHNARIVGAGDRVLVLAHGFGTDQTVWRHQAQEMARDRRVLLFDHIGAGGSDLSAFSPRRYRSLRGYAEDVLALLTELGPEQVDYVGHSMSAMIGLLAAQEEPERFRRMVFIGASPRYLNDEGYIGGFEQKDLDALYEAMTMNYQDWVSGFVHLAMGNPERPELALSFAASLLSMRPDIAVTVSRLLFQSDHRADLPGHRIPTLVIQSRHDIAVPMEVGDYLASHLPHATLERIDAQGHFPHLSAPDAVLRSLHQFLDAAPERG